MNSELADSIRSELGVQTLEGWLRSEGNLGQREPYIDQFLSYLSAESLVTPDNDIFLCTLTCLLHIIPRLNNASDETWINVASINLILADSKLQLNGALACLRDKIVAELSAIPPRPVNPCARCYAIDAALAAGARLTAYDIEQAGADDLFKAAPAMMVSLSARLQDPNICNIVHLIYNQIVNRNISPHNLASRIGYVIETAQKYISPEEIRPVVWEPLKSAFGSEQQNNEFESLATVSWPRFNMKKIVSNVNANVEEKLLEYEKRLLALEKRIKQIEWIKAVNTFNGKRPEDPGVSVPIDTSSVKQTAEEQKPSKASSEGSPELPRSLAKPGNTDGNRTGP